MPDTADSPTPSEAAVPAVHRVAVIDIGATSIRMAIGEVDANGRVRELDSFQHYVDLGKDTFTRGSISKATIEQCVEVLRKLRVPIAEYKVSVPDQVRIVATSAVREARNRLAFIDRVYVATGLQVEPIDAAEVNRVTYLGIRPFVRNEPALAEATTIVTEVGGGDTELLTIKDDNVTFAHTYRLGSLRLREALEAQRASERQARRVMETQIEQTVRHVLRRIPQGERVEMIAIGGDIRHATKRIIPSWEKTGMVQVQVDQLEELVADLMRRSIDEIVSRYRISYPDAGTLGPALLVYLKLAQGLQLSFVHVTNTNLRDGLLREMALQEAWTGDFRNQIVRSAIALGRRYDFDEAHACKVAEFCESLFHQLQELHELEPNDEVLLYVAALLHEIGGYVNNRSLHKHSMYLIRNSEIFGLGHREILQVSLIARYHRRALPQQNHEAYGDLSRDARVRVAKLAAILRLAIALDESRSQRISEVRCRLLRERIILEAFGVDDLSLEQVAMRQNAALFEEIFGRSVQIRRAATATRPD